MGLPRPTTGSMLNGALDAGPKMPWSGLGHGRRCRPLQRAREEVYIGEPFLPASRVEWWSSIEGLMYFDELGTGTSEV